MVRKYMWCLHCERTYLSGEYRYDPSLYGGQKLKLCPYPGCVGDVVVDNWAWDKQRKATHPEWPEIPVKGVVYHINPDNGK